MAKKRARRNISLGLPRNKWVNAKVQVTSGGKILARVSESVLGTRASAGGSAKLPLGGKRKNARYGRHGRKLKGHSGTKVPKYGRNSKRRKR